MGDDKPSGLFARFSMYSALAAVKREHHAAIVSPARTNRQRRPAGELADQGGEVGTAVGD
jgi:hypothetical protein